MNKTQTKRLIQLGISMFTIIPMVLGIWLACIIYNQLDIIQYARYSAICLMLILAFCIFFPLFMPYSLDERKKGFVFYWFVIAAIFNVTWQIPLVLFRNTITLAEISYDNLMKFIPWWGYGFADSHYGKVSSWMISEEIWWFLAIVISIRGLFLVRKNQEIRGFLLLGIAGALQSYNASLYIVYDCVTGLKNVPDNSMASLILYWGFNPLWAFCSLLASVFCFGIVLNKLETIVK